MAATLTPGTLKGVKPATATRPVEKRWERLAPYGYVAPFYVLFLVFGLFPLLFTFYVALFDWNPIGDKTFVGLANFQQLAADPRFWNALKNTFSIWIISTAPQLLIALVLAQVLNSALLRFATFFRMAMLLPYITSVAATAIVFAQLFNRDFGLLNWVIGGLGFQHVDFMSTPLAATSSSRPWSSGAGSGTTRCSTSPRCRPSRATSTRRPPWTERAGQAVLPHHAALAAAGHRLHRHHVDHRRAADLHRTLLLSNGTLTCGTARQCQTLSLFLYEQGFGSFKFGYGSAIGVALFAIIVVVAFINFLLSSRLGKKG